MGRIKRPAKTRGPKLSAEEPIDYDKKPPVFSLERIVAGPYCFSTLERDDKAAFGDAMYKRRQLTWGEIKQLGRHALGTEKIDRGSIKAGIPVHVKEDREHFLAFRFSGNKAMVGYRINDVFYVLWFDHDFTLYNHG